MARLARVVAVDVPHHVTQRGNARQYLLDADADRAVYFDLLSYHVSLHQLQLIGFCLMSNHVHLLLVPPRQDSLALALKQTHGRYASYWNARHACSGHVWQGRFYSCPLDEPHLWAALRYAELNPVRAGLVGQPADWRWSSAAYHSGLEPAPAVLDMDSWHKRWSFSEWRAYLAAPQSEEEILAIRQCTHTGRPLGGEDFVKALESSTGRQLVSQRGGRPAAPSRDENQNELEFDHFTKTGAK